MRRDTKQDGTFQRHRHSGSVTLEFIIAFPLVFIATLAIAQFFFLVLIIDGATTALNEGTRKGAEAYPVAFPLDAGGANNDIADKIIATMNAHLAIYELEVVNNGVDTAKNNVTIAIARGVSAEFTRGGGTCSTMIPGPGANEIVVAMCFNLTNGNDGGPVPNWLSNFGFSLAGTTFEMTSRASLE